MSKQNLGNNNGGIFGGALDRFLSVDHEAAEADVEDTAVNALQVDCDIPHPAVPQRNDSITRLRSASDAAIISNQTVPVDQPDFDALPSTTDIDSSSDEDLLDEYYMNPIRSPVNQRSSSSNAYALKQYPSSAPVSPIVQRPQTTVIVNPIPGSPSKKKPIIDYSSPNMARLSERKRDTAISLLTTRNARKSVMPDISSTLRIQPPDLDEIPSVNLPGYNPHSPKLSQSATQQRPPSVSKRISALREDDLESGGVKRRRSLVHPERDPNPRKPEYVFAGKYNYSPSDNVQPKERPLLLRQPSRLQSRHAKLSKDPESQKTGPKTTIWRKFSRFITIYAPASILSYCGMRNPNVQQAWREKMALVSIIVFMCILLAFITFGLEYVTCGLSDSRRGGYPVHIFNSELVNIRGELYSIKDWQHPGTRVELFRVAGRDVSWMFPVYPSYLSNGRSACENIPNVKTVAFSCTVDGVSMTGHCHTEGEYDQTINSLKYVGYQTYRWQDIENSNKYMVYNGWVLNLDRYFIEGKQFLGGDDFDEILVRNLGQDSTREFWSNNELKMKMECLLERFKVGRLNDQSMECYASQFFMWISLMTILALVAIRFSISLFYIWTDGRKVGRKPPTKSIAPPSPIMKRAAFNPESANPRKSRYSTNYNLSNRNLPMMNPPPRADSNGIVDMRGLLPSIMMVPCYSEGEASIRGTLDSLANTDFPDTHKMLFIIADGLITGSGNDLSTPEILIDLLEIDPQFEYPPPPHSYVAIAEGTKRHNMAQVFAGKYNYNGHCVPTILVVKCGTPEECNDKKPGNRGKRDSQLILMQFLSKVMFDDRMTPLEFDIFTKMTAVCSAPIGVPLDYCAEKMTPDVYELVLMVDADTVVEPSSLRTMSYAMSEDSRLIGLCGETKIANKNESFITMIQVFEYFISHYLSKSFESVFGTVTCLPGCFCMYRVKAPKPYDDGIENQYYVPILANPDIVEAYSEHVVDTLHKKNLYLLGEDRYLTTLMLKQFPKRRLKFIPNASCKTVVPDTFDILKSQRRRWINSTIHNLFELVLVRELCGIFCFSMQFVILMELIGTAVLPAAITFTVYLAIISFFLSPPPWVPLILLLAILGSPAILIFLGGTRWKYFLYMIVYILALPIWNFALPVYAFWHFDDFGWGETRKVEGIGLDKGHDDNEGLFDSSKIVMKRWFEWERIRRKQLAKLRKVGIQRGMQRTHSRTPDKELESDQSGTQVVSSFVNTSGESLGKGTLFESI